MKAIIEVTDEQLEKRFMRRTAILQAELDTPDISDWVAARIFANVLKQREDALERKVDESHD